MKIYRILQKNFLRTKIEKLFIVQSLKSFTSFLSVVNEFLWVVLEFRLAKRETVKLKAKKFAAKKGHKEKKGENNTVYLVGQEYKKTMINYYKRDYT